MCVVFMPFFLILNLICAKRILIHVKIESFINNLLCWILVINLIDSRNMHWVKLHFDIGLFRLYEASCLYGDWLIVEMALVAALDLLSLSLLEVFKQLTLLNRRGHCQDHSLWNFFSLNILLHHFDGRDWRGA